MKGYVATRAVQSETRDAALICPTTRTWIALNPLSTIEWLASHYTLLLPFVYTDSGFYQASRPYKTTVCCYIRFFVCSLFTYS